MFIRNATIDEVAASLEENLANAHKFEETRTQDRRTEVINKLTVAAEILDEAGLEEEAQAVTIVLAKLAKDNFGPTINDPSLPKSSEQAVKNLEEKGWMFNAEDGEDVADVADQDVVEI